MLSGSLGSRGINNPPDRYRERKGCEASATVAILSTRADTRALGESLGLRALEEVNDSSARAAAFVGDERGEEPEVGAAGDFRGEALSAGADVAADVAATGQRTASIMSVSSAENTEPCT